MQQLLNCSAMQVSRELQDGRLTGTPYCRRSQALRLNAQCKYYCSTGVPCPCSCKAFPHMLCLSKPCHCTDALQRQLPGCGSSSCRLATYCNVMHTHHMQCYAHTPHAAQLAVCSTANEPLHLKQDWQKLQPLPPHNTATDKAVLPRSTNGAHVARCESKVCVMLHALQIHTRPVL